MRNNTFGPLIDTYTVVRLKRGLLETHDRKSWGSRTDYLFARSPAFDHGHFPFWLWEGDEIFWKKYSHRKPSTGTCAVFRAAKELQPSSITLIGFDYVLRPETATGWWHDARAEKEALLELGVTELV